MFRVRYFQCYMKDLHIHTNKKSSLITANRLGERAPIQRTFRQKRLIHGHSNDSPVSSTLLRCSREGYSNLERSAKKSRIIEKSHDKSIYPNFERVLPENGQIHTNKLSEVTGRCIFLVL